MAQEDTGAIAVRQVLAGRMALRVPGAVMLAVGVEDIPEAEVTGRLGDDSQKLI
ncbi:MAG: hypothetical protein WBW82_10290 [Candidatus Sulfotelmatobacter sp.]